MPDITKFKRGNWLKACDTKSGELIKFLDAGTEVDSFGRPAMEFLIELSDGSEIKMTPNRPSIAALAEVFGDNSDNWVGKSAIIEVKTETIQGEDKDIIYLTPNSELEATTEAPQSPVTSEEPKVISKDEIPVIESSDDGNQAAQIAADDDKKNE